MLPQTFLCPLAPLMLPIIRQPLAPLPLNLDIHNPLPLPNIIHNLLLATLMIEVALITQDPVANHPTTGEVEVLDNLTEHIIGNIITLPITVAVDR